MSTPPVIKTFSGVKMEVSVKKLVLKNVNGKVGFIIPNQNKCNGRSFTEVLTHGRQVSTHTVHSRSESLTNSQNTGKHKCSIFWETG